MGILDTLKNVLGDKASDAIGAVTNAASDAAGAVTDATATGAATDGVAGLADMAKDAMSGGLDMAAVAKDFVADKVTDAVSGFVNFDDINVSAFRDMAEKFGLMDNLPEDIKSKLTDGTLSDDDVKAWISEHKDVVSSFVAEHKDEVMGLLGKLKA